MIIPLSSEETRAVLRDGRVARLGCIADGEPYVVPVYYIYEDDCVYVHSLPGRKIAALRSNPRACLQVDDIRDEYHWRSVLAFGRYEEITDLSKSNRVLLSFFARFPHLTPVESTLKHTTEPPGLIVFCVRLERVTGIGEGLSRSTPLP